VGSLVCSSFDLTLLLFPSPGPFLNVSEHRASPCVTPPFSKPSVFCEAQNMLRHSFSVQKSLRAPPSFMESSPSDLFFLPPFGYRPPPIPPGCLPPFFPSNSALMLTLSSCNLKCVPAPPPPQHVEGESYYVKKVDLSPASSPSKKYTYPRA